MADDNVFRGKARLRNRTQAHHFRDSIMRLHGEGKTDKEIALIIGLTTAAVTEERESLGLATATSGGIKFSPHEDNLIVTFRDKNGFRWTEIAKKMASGHTSTQVQMRYNYLDGLRTRRGKNGEKKIRVCKNPECQVEFMSEGHHVRYCDRCRDSELRHVDFYVVSHAYGSALEQF